MRNLDEIFLFHLIANYQMTPAEVALTECRAETYQLYRNKKDELDYLRRKLRDLV